MSKLLIVENQKNLALLYKREFLEDGYDVILAREGNEAINKTKRYHPDLVIMDIRLPGLDGITTMGEILQINKNIPIIINTEYPIYKDDFITWAVKTFVIKSGDLTELKNEVSKFLDN